MRITRLAAGGALLSVLILAGCSGPAASTPESDDDTVSKSECPVLEEGISVEASAFVACVKDAMRNPAGYAATAATGGYEKKTKVNPSEKAYQQDDPAGSIVAIGDKTWVKPAGGAWVQGDPGASDETIATLSGLAAGIASEDPLIRTTAATGTLTVKGTDEMLGQKVFSLIGSREHEGDTITTVFQTTADYIVLGTSATTSDVTVTMELTEWDKKQDIQPPQ